MAIAPEHGKRIFRKTERDLLRVASRQTPETVHSFRTTTRRLQTLLEYIAPEKRRNQKKLLKLLNRIRRAAGRVRDVDVQLAALRSLKTSQEPRRKTQLTQTLIDLRGQHEKKLRKLVSDESLHDVRKRLKRVAGDVRYKSAKDPLAIAKEMLAAIQTPAGPPDEGLLHHYRIVVKRARYAAEFASETREVAQFLVRLKRLQDALGHWHDWLNLTHTAVEQIGDVHQSSLVAALYNVTRGKFRNAVAAVSAERTHPEKKAVVIEAAQTSPAPKSGRVGRMSAAA